jgi:hypothetical protein
MQLQASWRLQGDVFLRRAPERPHLTCVAFDRISRAGVNDGELKVSTSRPTLVLALALAGVPNRPSRQFWRPAPHNLGLLWFLRRTEASSPLQRGL